MIEITPQFIADFFSQANQVFVDMLPLLLVLVGLQVGFFILSRAFGIIGNWGVGKRYSSYEAETDRWFEDDEEEDEE